jgi:hypothetical protein
MKLVGYLTMLSLRGKNIPVLNCEIKHYVMKAHEGVVV